MYLATRSVAVSSLCTVRVPSPVPVAVRSEAWVYGHSLFGIAGSNLAGRHECLFIVSLVCCQIEVCAQG